MFSGSLGQFFLRVGQNNSYNKIPLSLPAAISHITTPDSNCMLLKLDELYKRMDGFRNSNKTLCNWPQGKCATSEMVDSGEHS